MKKLLSMFLALVILVGTIGSSVSVYAHDMSDEHWIALDEEF